MATAGGLAFLEDGGAALIGTGTSAATALGSGASVATGLGLGGVTAGGIATATSMIGSAMGAVGGLEQASTQRQLGENAQAGQNLNAATMQNQAAQDAMQAERQNRMVRGNLMAQAGALGSYGGSALDVINDAGNQSVEQVSRILNNGSLSAQSYRLAGQDARTSANMQARQSTIGAFGSLLSGTSNTLYLKSALQAKPLIKPNLGAPGKNPLLY